VASIAKKEAEAEAKADGKPKSRTKPAADAIPVPVSPGKKDVSKSPQQNPVTSPKGQPAASKGGMTTLELPPQPGSRKSSLKDTAKTNAAAEAAKDKSGRKQERTDSTKGKERRDSAQAAEKAASRKERRDSAQTEENKRKDSEGKSKKSSSGGGHSRSVMLQFDDPKKYARHSKKVHLICFLFRGLVGLIIFVV